MENDWTKVLGFPGYRVYKQEIDEEHKHLKLWIRRKRGNRSLICAGCGRRVHQMHEVYDREIRDLPVFEYQSTGDLNELFQINRRVFKAYLLKESLEGLWDYRYPGAMLNYLEKWVDQLKWQRLAPGYR